jgi:DUF2959 family protein
MHQQLVPRLVSVVTATTVVAWMSFVALPSAQRSETEGIKETETFVKAGADTSSALGKGRTQVQTTLDAYNALVTQPSKNMKGDYKKLLNAAKDTDQKVDDARARVTTMEATGNTYFAGRAATIKDIQSEELRKQAQERLDQNQSDYAAMMASLKDAGQSLHTLRTDLDNQITYLGSDLTPSAMTSLKPQAQKLNERGAQVLADADRAIATADKYFDALRPAKS